MIIIRTLEELGKYVNLMRSMFSMPEKFSMYWKEMLRQMDDIGIGSIVIVAIISFFIGAVTATQFSYQLADSFIPFWYIGYIVRDIMIIELAPTISCLVLAGKVGSNMAAEIGGMRQKEQIDALEIMGVNTASYLIAPKILAALFVIPFLIIFAAFLGIIGGYVVSNFSPYLTPTDYVYGLRQFFIPYNVTLMMIKAVVFSFILTSVSCYHGYFVKGGSIELGNASTQAVVMSNILILLADFMIASLFT
ncbi:MAG: MlaE family ABC transporter permease [Saprospiraceae bacterium]